MSYSRICRIVGRLFFLAAVGLSIYYILFALEQNKGDYSCFEQMNKAESIGHIDYGNYYFCLDKRTGNAYSPLHDPVLMSKLENMARMQSPSVDPNIVKGRQLNFIAESTRLGIEQKILVPGWNVKELIKLITFWSAMIIFAYPVGFYLMKIIINLFSRLIK